jgi:DHA2 family multidrug resistance protein-like MFS transporter
VVPGLLEATSYELGTCLRISLFGVFMSAAYRHTIAIPEGLALVEAEQAVRSIGDTYLVAQRLGVEQAATLIDAGKNAFSATHSVLLTTAAGLIGVLVVQVVFMLASYREKGAAKA